MATKNPKLVMKLGADSTEAVTEVKKVGTATKEVAKEVNAAGASMGGAFKQVEAGASDAVAATTRQVNAFSNIIKRATAEAATLGQGQAARLEKLAELKFGFVPAELTGQLANLRAFEAAAAKSLTNVGMTAKATNAALRQVPAQFTDIIVSLQGGQAPLTVLLQQGGQLKDIFGSAGTAAKALGGYILGLINPFTVAAAAVGTLGYAYYTGSEEAKAFNKTLIETGGASGVTVGQLTDIAKAMDSLGTTQGRAAETLNTFAAAGVSGAVALERYALAAIKLEDAGGSAIKDTVKAFAELGKEPLSASLKLNESMNYLTESVYRQIKSLEEQGRYVEAATVAQNAYAQAIENRTPAILSNLGLIERAWLGLKNAGKEAWDFAKDIGRTDSLETQAKALADTIAKYKKQGYNTTDEEAQLTALTKRIRLQQDSAQLDQQRGESVKALSEYEKLTLKFQTDKERNLKEEIKLRNVGLAAGKTELQIQEDIAKLRASRAKAPAKERDGFDQEQGKAYAKYIEESSKALLDAQVKTDGLTKSQGALVAMLVDPVFQSMPETWRQTALQAKYAAIAQEQSNAATDAATAENAKYVASLNESAAAVEKKLQSLGDETKAYALSIEKNISLAEAIDLVAIARLEEAKAVELSYGDEKAVAAIQREIDARKKLRVELNKQANHTAEVEAGKKAAADVLAEWKRGWEETDRLARDAFTSWAENGTSMADAIGKALKKALLSAIYEATIRPIALQLYTSIVGDKPGAIGGVAGSALSSAGNSILGSVIGGGASIGALGTAFGEGFMATLGGSTLSGGGAAGILATGGAAGAGVAGTIGAAAPYLLAAAALKSAMDYKVESRGNGLTATIGGANGLPSGQVGTFNEFQQTGGLLGGGTTINRDWAVADQSVANYISTNVQAITAANKAYAGALGLTSDAIDNFTKAIEVNITGLDAAGQKAAIDAELAKFSAEQAAAAYSDAVKAYARDGETATQTVQRLATDLVGVNNVFAALGYTLMDVSAAGGAAASGLAAAFGSLQSMQQQTAALYSNYYTQAEQKASTVSGVVTSLGAAGITGFTAEDVANASREQIRAVVDQYSKGIGTAQGDKQYAAIVSAANALNAYVPAFESIAQQAAPAQQSSGGGGGGGSAGSSAADSIANAWQSITDSIWDEVKRIRGLIEGTGEDAYAAAQARFTIATAQARAGDQEAAAALPELSQNLLMLAEANAQTLVQLRLMQGQTSSSLTDTGNLLALKYGTTIPRFAEGTNYTQEGLAYLHEGEAVVPRAYNPAAGNSNQSELIAEVRALRSQVAELQASSSNTANAATQMARQINTVTEGGRAMQTEAYS